MIANQAEFICGICQELLFQPKELPCQHRFCCACLKGHCVQTGSGNAFLCPTCQKEVKIDAGDIPLIEFPDKIATNALKEKQLEKFHMIKQKKNTIKCGFCFSKWKISTATKFCRTCEEYFCNECGNQHWLLRSSKAHRVWLIDDIKKLKEDPFVRGYLTLMFNARIKHINKTSDTNIIDTDRCSITGLSFLPDGQLVLFDKANEKLKLFDRSMVFRTQEKVQGHDVLMVNRSLLVVSCPDLNTLIYFNVNKGVLTRENVVETEEKCYGLSNNDSNSFFTAISGNRVSLLKIDPTDKVKRVEIAPGKLTLTIPHYLAHSVQNETFCLSDLSNKCVKCVSKTGDVLWERNINDCGAVISFADYYLLARQDRNTVDLIRSDGQILKSFLTTNEALSKVTVLSADTWKVDLGSVRIAVVDDTDLVFVYTAEDPSLELDWLPYSRGNKLNQVSSRKDGENISRTCEIL